MVADMARNLIIGELLSCLLVISLLMAIWIVFMRLTTASMVAPRISSPSKCT